MILTKNNLIYFGIAIIVGVIMSFGIVGFTYHPVPLQVPEDQYIPIAPPAPAIVTLAPQYVPGSAADQQKDTVPDKYAPAKPPAVITTAPLPTITPEPIETIQNAQTTVVCQPNAYNATNIDIVICNMAEIMFDLIQIILCIILLIIFINLLLIFSNHQNLKR